MKKYSVLLIGCGHIGMEHLLDIYYRDDINIYAVVDIDESLAKKAAARCNAQRWGTDYRKFIRDDNIDIIIIATFSSTHLTILKDCLAAGKHVLCEKPIAISEEDGREFVRVVK
ncbi:MAG: Gfo/Idh/MocA family oxidoreductase, partial [Clostridiales bacterium]|nr:Gfo/Idh/MocA family oxidoreductase [Clostridiales bacterium]